MEDRNDDAVNCGGNDGVIVTTTSAFATDATPTVRVQDGAVDNGGANSETMFSSLLQAYADVSIR